MNKAVGSLRVWMCAIVTVSILAPSATSCALPSQELTTESHEYEGYYYATYHFSVMGDAPLTVVMGSQSFDSYIILVQPDGAILTNDDHSDLGPITPDSVGDAGIRIHEPRAGQWSLLATSYHHGSTGSFEILLDGATDLKPVTEVSLEHVKDMYEARGVVDAEEIRERRVMELVDQLSLETFRVQLRNRLLAKVRELEETANRERTRLVEFEEEQRDLEGVTEDLDLLPDATRRFLRTLLDEKRAAAMAIKKSVTSELREATTNLAAFHQAIEELEELRMVAADLDQFYERLMEEMDIRELHSARSDIRGARARFEQLAYDIARKLLDSGLADQLRFGGVERLEDRFVESHSDNEASFAGNEVSFARFVPRDRRSILWSAPSFDPYVWLPALLPWPPPDPSARLVLHAELLRYPNGGAPVTLGELADLLQVALREAGYDGGGYLGVPTGFAIVTRIEQTNGLGEPLDGKKRWVTSIAEWRRFSLSEYIRLLLTAPAGYFRVLAFVVASVPFSSSGSRDRLKAIQTWVSASAGSLPEQLKEHRLHNGYEVTVLVYEFLKRRESDRPKTTVPGHLTARQHLVHTGLDGLLLGGEG